MKINLVQQQSCSLVELVKNLVGNCVSLRLQLLNLFSYLFSFSERFLLEEFHKKPGGCLHKVSLLYIQRVKALLFILGGKEFSKKQHIGSKI